MSVEKPQDLLDIGKHCYKCRQLDFLPFSCELCGHVYCLEHRHHGCKLEDSPPPRQQLNLPTAQSLFPDRASDLKKIDERIQSRPTNIIQQDRNAMHKLQKYLNLHKLLTLMKMFNKKSTSEVLSLKKTAKGDPKVPVADRVYLWIVHIDDSKIDTNTNKTLGSKNTDTGSKTAVYVSLKWVAGRALDSITDTLRIVNINNSVNNQAERLHLFTEDAKQIPTSEKMAKMKSGEVIYLVKGTMEK